jgi:hypothetical protein
LSSFQAPGVQLDRAIALAPKPRLGVAQRSIVSQQADESVAGDLEVQPVAEDVVGGECGRSIRGRHLLRLGGEIESEARVR